MASKIRLIALDMDGTLLDPSVRLTAGNLSAIRDAQSEGIVVSICTGRFFENASIFAVDHGLACPMITLNGGQVSTGPFGEMLVRHPMPVDTALEAFACLEEMGASYYVFGDRLVGSRWSDMVHHSQADYGERMRTVASTEYVVGSDSILRMIRQGIYKFYVNLSDDAAQRQMLGKALRALPGLDVTSSSSSNYELMPLGVNKARGIEELAAVHGIGMAQVMAIGDHDNDLMMIRKAGLGVAMGNAVPAIMEAADIVTGSNAEDGVAQAIRRYALGEGVGQG